VLTKNYRMDNFPNGPNMAQSSDISLVRRI